MDTLLTGRARHAEHLSLAERPYTLPRRAVRPAPGDRGVGRCSIRMLRTWLSRWRGAGAALYPAGVWPHPRHDTSAGPLFAARSLSSDPSSDRGSRS